MTSNCDKTQTLIYNKMKQNVIVEGNETHMLAKFETCRVNSKKDGIFFLFSDVIE